MGIHHSRLTSEGSPSIRNLLNEGKLISLLYNQEWEKVVARLEKYPREAKTPFQLHQKSIYPLHAACALPEIPMIVIQALVKADPEGPTRFSSSEKVQGYHRARSVSSSEVSSFTSGDISSISNSTASSDTMEGGSEWLPLHVAVFYGLRVEVVEYLMEQYPAAVTLKNGQWHASSSFSSDVCYI